MDPRNEQFGLNPSIAKGSHGKNSFGGVNGGKVRGACDGTKSPESADMSSAPKGGAPSPRGSLSWCIQNHNQNWERAVQHSTGSSKGSLQEGMRVPGQPGLQGSQK